MTTDHGSLVLCLALHISKLHLYCVQSKGFRESFAIVCSPENQIQNLRSLGPSPSNEKFMSMLKIVAELVRIFDSQMSLIHESDVHQNDQIKGNNKSLILGCRN